LPTAASLVPVCLSLSLVGTNKDKGGFVLASGQQNKRDQTRQPNLLSNGQQFQKKKKNRVTPAWVSILSSLPHCFHSPLHSFLPFPASFFSSFFLSTLSSLYPQPHSFPLTTAIYTHMCGIFAYLNYLTAVDRQTIADILTNGLKRLEYRGYDSAGKNSFTGSCPLSSFPTNQMAA